MKTIKVDHKLVYILSCLILATFLFGCKEIKRKISVFDYLPESTYLTEVKSAIENKKPVIVAFLAEWCPHCKKYKPVFLEAKNEYGNQITFLNIDVDDTNGSALSNRFQVKGIPTTAFVRPDGSVFKVQVGGIEKENLTQIIQDLLKSKRKRRGEPIAPFPIEPQEAKEAPKKEQPTEAPQELIKEKEEEPIEPAVEPTQESVPEAPPSPVIEPEPVLEETP